LAVPSNDFGSVWLNESHGLQDLAQQQEGMSRMAETRVGIRVADDRKTVAVEIGPVGGASSPVGLDLDQLSRLIHLLGQARRRMVENLPPHPLDGKTVETIIEPMWYIQIANIDGSLLAFDHPAFGPIGFALPRKDVVKIVRTLSEHLALPAVQPDKPS
jgi:hypothetical protein